MDLYASPLACSFAVHVACLEAGLPVRLHYVERKTKRLADGRSYLDLAPLGLVPTLVTDEGEKLAEMATVLQWIADAAPARGLGAPWGTKARWDLVSALHFVGTELHKKHLYPIFAERSPDPVRAWARSEAGPALAHAARLLGDRETIVGDAFTVADAYLFWGLLIAPYGGVSLDAFPTLGAYVARHRKRPTIAAALRAEVPLYQAEVAHGGAIVTASAAG